MGAVWAVEVSEGNTINDGYIARPFLFVLLKSVTAFGLCPKNLPEAEQKHLGLISLAKEISRQPDTLCPMVTSDHSYTGLRASKAKRNTK